MKNIIPTQKQLDFLNWELGCFFHFGLRTFYDGQKDWEMDSIQSMDLKEFNPKDLDCEQWIETVKKAGGNYAVLVAKHHDSFANWPSKYTEYSVKNTPWKDGKGDVVKEFTDACKKYDIKIGIYYSPAEFSFMKDKKDKKTDKEYDDYFINQIGELLTNYGKIDYLWFDGCGSENHQYDTKRIIKEIRTMQPDILIFNMWDPDTRWIGNEAGFAQNPHWNTVKDLNISIMTDKKDIINEETFLPGECDCRIRKDNWFYSENDSDTVKSLDELMGLYYYSVGRGANLLVNIAPDKNGLLPELDRNRFLDFGAEIKKRFAEPIIELKNPKLQKNSITVLLDEDKLINHIILKEDLKNGESIKRFRISVNPYPYGKPICIYEGYNIGNKSICQFPSIRGKSITLEILESYGDYEIKNMAFYYVL